MKFQLSLHLSHLVSDVEYSATGIFHAKWRKHIIMSSIKQIVSIGNTILQPKGVLDVLRRYCIGLLDQLSTAWNFDPNTYIYNTMFQRDALNSAF
jgi:hypothetical protein